MEVDLVEGPAEPDGRGFTDMVLYMELKVTGGLELSLAMTLNVYDPVVENLPKLLKVSTPSVLIVFDLITLPGPNALAPIVIVPGPLT